MKQRELNRFRLTIPSRSQNESFARTAVSAFAARLDPTLDELSDIKAAVSEAVTNSIVHGYPDTIGEIEIICRILTYDGAECILYIRIRDKGVGISDIPLAMTPMYTSAPEGERAGLGFAVMQSFMDGVKVRSAAGKGTSVTMTKKLTPRD